MRDPEFCEALLDEAAGFLNVSRSSLDSLLASGINPSQIAGNSRLISMDDLAAHKANINQTT